MYIFKFLKNSNKNELKLLRNIFIVLSYKIVYCKKILNENNFLNILK